MIQIEQIQKRITANPNRSDVKTCLREASSMARGGDALLSIKYLIVGIYGILKIRDLTKPEKKTFNDNIYKILGSIDLMPMVKEATEGEGSLTSLLEEKGLKALFSKLQAITKEIKNLEQKAIQLKAQQQKEEIIKNIAAISKELEKGNVGAAKNKADRLLESHPDKKEKFLEKIIEIFAEKESIKGWWHYIQKRYQPDKCNLEEARYCATQISKIRSLDAPENAKNWYRNSLDFRLKVWELTPKDDPNEIDAVIEACYNLAICVYYAQDKINNMVPKQFGRELIEEGLKYAPDSSHLKKMGKTFGVRK
jgi:hypothetical protein